MRFVRAIFLLLMASGLNACGAHSPMFGDNVRAAGDTTVLHLRCAGSSVADLTVGTLEGSLEGAAAGVAVAAEVVNGRIDNEALWFFVGGSAAVGGTLGAGAGLGGQVLKLPGNYGECLRTYGPQVKRMPKI